MEVTRQESVTPDADNNKETETMLSVLKGLDSLKIFQEMVEKKLFDLEQALISKQATPSNNSVGDENGTSGFTLNILKNRKGKNQLRLTQTTIKKQKLCSQF